MAEGVDYSHSRPNPQCLYDADKRFVVRYVGPDTASGKWLREGEKDRLRAAGLQIALVHETVAGAPLLGRAEGIEDALQGQSMAHALGIVGRPIYFALDIDPRPLTSAQWTAVKAYCDGAASVIGRSRVGMYGGFKAIDVLCPEWAPYGWQTYAWSAGQWSPKAQLRQYLNGQDLCGGELDLCRSMAPDFGQWPYQEDDMTPEEHQLLVDAEARSKSTLQLVRDQIDPNVDKLLARPVPPTAAQIAAAVVAALPAGAVDVQALAEAVAEELHERLAG